MDIREFYMPFAFAFQRRLLLQLPFASLSSGLCFSSFISSLSCFLICFVKGCRTKEGKWGDDTRVKIVFSGAC